MSSGDSATGIADLHSHLVPGVDDGAESVGDALEGIGRMVDAGVTAIVTTPHLDGSVTRDATRLAGRLRDLDEAFAAVAEAVAEAFPDLIFERGCEISLDRPDVDLSLPGVRIAGGRFVLVEWPRLRIPPATTPAIRSIVERGLVPVIAHPERYLGFDEALSAVPLWRKEGAVLQMNHGSLSGRYGTEVRARAFRLLSAGWVDCLSTDFHGRPRLGLFIRDAAEVFDRLDASTAWELLTRTNPHRILRGEDPLPVPPVAGEGGVIARLRALFRE